jgi:hypothetical protein
MEIPVRVELLLELPHPAIARAVSDAVIDAAARIDRR